MFTLLLQLLALLLAAACVAAAWGVGGVTLDALAGVPQVAQQAGSTALLVLVTAAVLRSRLASA